MSKSISYYDWELSFKKPVKEEKQVQIKSKGVNSLGVSEMSFKYFLSEWKKKNL